MSRSAYARSLHLDSCVETMELSSKDVLIADVEQERLSDLTGNREKGSKLVQVGVGTAFVGSADGERHHAAFSSICGSSEDPSRLPAVTDLCHTTIESTDSNNLESPGF